MIKPDDYVIFDCPGQIELFSDQSLFREIVKVLQEYGMNMVMGRFFFGVDVYD